MDSLISGNFQIVLVPLMESIYVLKPFPCQDRRFFLQISFFATEGYFVKIFIPPLTPAAESNPFGFFSFHGGLGRLRLFLWFCLMTKEI